uniref:Preprotein-translocase subunit g n=1 Tax=Sphondylothamnion multifidum TaxID=193186 RepID=A0A4D6X1T3_9FLOR|nr:Preprotein-translocase subunit g [Sphondylothamnion multifidum]
MIKILWYCVSSITILLILLYNPIGNTSSIMSSNQVFNMGSNQELIIKSTIISIFFFFIFTIVSVNLTFN